jgi:hypothetical protein
MRAPAGEQTQPSMPALVGDSLADEVGEPAQIMRLRDAAATGFLNTDRE